MADQARYNQDPNKRKIANKVGEIAAKSANTVSRVAAAAPGIGTGIETGAASMSEFQQAEQALRKKIPRGPAASPALTTGLVDAAELTPAERQSFANQSKNFDSRAGLKPARGAATTTPAASPATPAASAPRAAVQPGSSPSLTEAARGKTGFVDNVKRVLNTNLGPGSAPKPIPTGAAAITPAGGGVGGRVLDAGRRAVEVAGKGANMLKTGAGIAAKGLGIAGTAYAAADAIGTTAGENTQDMRRGGAGVFDSIVDSVSNSAIGRGAGNALEAMGGNEYTNEAGVDFVKDMAARTVGGLQNFGSNMIGGDGVAKSLQTIIGSGVEDKTDYNGRIGAKEIAAAKGQPSPAAGQQYAPDVPVRAQPEEAKPVALANRPGYFVGSDGQRREITYGNELTGTGANSLGTAGGGTFDVTRGPVAMGGGGYAYDNGGGGGAGGQPGAAAGGNLASASRPQGGISAGIGMGGNVGGGQNDSVRSAALARDKRLTDLRDPTSQAGAMFKQLMNDKTPTGKRVAAGFLEQYLGQGTSEFDTRVNAQTQSDNQANSLQIARENNAAGNTGRAPQYITGDDGMITSISDGVAAPVNGPDGKPARVAKRGTKASPADEQKYVLNALKINGGDTLFGEEREKAIQQYRNEYLKQLQTEQGNGE